MKEEEWKDIIGYEGLYQISNLGNVKSLFREYQINKFTEEKLLMQSKNKNGYCGIVLSKDGKQKHYLVHRLVASAFIPNPNNLPQINHKDENPSNNCASNLEWCTAKYNNNYGSRLERVGKANKGKKHSQETKDKIGIAQQKLIVQLKLNGEFIKYWSSAKQASNELNIFATNITRCCKGKQKYAKGFKWMYLEDYINKQIQYLNELKTYKERLRNILKNVS